jgi:hypothetical protein
VAAPEWARSAIHCHVSQPYWSTSAATPPDRDTWQPLVEPPQQPSATWHPPIGPRQQVGPTQAQVT